jgi:AIG2-like family
MSEMEQTPNSTTIGAGDLRRVDVFFYGMFMDADILRGAGLSPASPEIAVLEGYELRIGNRAALVPKETTRVFGVVMSLTLREVAQLYAEESLTAYRPEPVLVALTSGQKTAALCYNLADPPSPGIGNREYAAKLREVARKVGLPPDYVASLD